MATDGDAYRILGLPPGAPLIDVKRAYRRLAKANHPDTAGDAAMQRFLAIQAAYESLVGGDSHGRRRPGAARPAPWSADPERTRATRESWQRRTGRRSRPSAETDPGTGTGTGADADAGAGAAGSARTQDPAAGPRRRRPGGGPRRSDADRAPDRATPGSTSYDYAEQEAFDPEWSGASWYGQSSGTYWTINPKEYADPRKHGPEYQARGRRRPGAPDDAPPASDPIGAESDSEPVGEPAGEADRPAEAASPARPAGPARTARPTASRPPPRRSAPPAPRDPLSAGTSAPMALDALPWSAGPGGRIGLALIGWPPIGLALALLLGELSGCARLAATCVEEVSIGSWFAQVGIIGLLLLVPPLAAVAAVGTIAILAAAIPSVVLLTAIGGAYDRTTAGGVLLFMLAVAWAAGVGFAVLRRSRTVPP